MNRRRLWCIGLAWCLCVGLALGAWGNPGEVETLVRQLGSDQFARREAATQALDRLGAAALPALRAAAAGNDAEVRRRAQRLIQDIEQRLETAELLQPTTIRLDYHDVPLGKILKDLSNQMAFASELAAEPKELADRRVTIQTPELPFWEAFQQLCEKAEVTPQRSQPRNSSAAVNANQQFGAIPPVVMMSESAITVVAGKPAPLPTFHAGALRLRALPSHGGDFNAANHEASLTLELAIEPKIHWLNLVQLRFDEVRDDGKRLLVAMPPEETPRQMSEEEIIQMQLVRAAQQRRVAMKFGGDFGGGNSSGLGSGLFQAKVRFKLPEEGLGKSIPLLKGTLTAQMQTPVQALATIEDPAQASPQPVKAKDGAEIRIVSFKTAAEGAIEARVDVIPAQSALGPGNMVVNMQVVVGGNGNIRGLQNGLAATLSQTPLTLKDGEGKLYTLASVRQNVEINNNGGLTQKYTLYWRPPQAKSAPKALLYVGSRLATIEVPFELKDVPLP